MRRNLKIVSAVGALLLLVPVMAWGGANNGEIDRLWIRTGVPFETSDDAWRTIDSFTLSANVGPIVSIRLTGDAYAQDFGAGGVFKGRKYAAMNVRIKVDGVVIPPGPLVMASNAGQIGVQARRPMGNSLEWWWQTAAPDPVIKIQARSRTQGDQAGFTKWSLTALYNQMS